MINDLEIQRAIRLVAEQSGMTPQQVRRNIEQMLAESRTSTDPNAQAAWADIPCSGEIPTLEEVMKYLADRITKERQ